MAKIGMRDYEALADAAERPGGWALFKRKTTEKGVAKGWFIPAEHPTYGAHFKITQAGLAAYQQAKMVYNP